MRVELRQDVRESPQEINARNECGCLFYFEEIGDFVDEINDQMSAVMCLNFAQIYFALFDIYNGFQLVLLDTWILLKDLFQESLSNYGTKIK